MTRTRKGTSEKTRRNVTRERLKLTVRYVQLCELCAIPFVFLLYAVHRRVSAFNLIASIG